MQNNLGGGPAIFIGIHLGADATVSWRTGCPKLLAVPPRPACRVHGAGHGNCRRREGHNVPQRGAAAPNYYVRVFFNSYSVDSSFMGRIVDGTADLDTVWFTHDRLIVATHLRGMGTASGGDRSDPRGGDAPGFGAQRMRRPDLRKRCRSRIWPPTTRSLASTSASSRLDCW